MLINNDDYVVVFKLPDDLFFKSYFTNCEIGLNFNDLVAVFEEKCTLALGSSTYKVKWDQYMNLIQGCNIEEMKYSEYLKMYRDNVIKCNPDAPVIVRIDEDSPGTKTVNVAGANILLQRY